jgi:O-antigen ligase
VREQPIVGVGFGRGSSFYIDVRSSNGFLVPFRQDIGQDPHDGYLFLLAGGGILALGSFLALIAVFTIDAWRRYRGSTDDTERLLIMWVGATLFCFLFEASSGTMFEFPSDLLPIWALLVLPGVVPLRSRLGGGLRRTTPVTA